MSIKRTTKTELSPIAGMGLTIYLDINDDQLYLQDDNGIRALLADYLPSVTGANIYNSNGTLTSNRTLSGAGYTLSFNNIDNLNYDVNIGTLFSGTGSFTVNVSLNAVIQSASLSSIGTDSNNNLLSINSSGTTSLKSTTVLNVNSANIFVTATQTVTFDGQNLSAWTFSGQVQVGSKNTNDSVHARVQLQTGIIALRATAGFYVYGSGVLKYKFPLTKPINNQVLTAIDNNGTLAWSDSQNIYTTNGTLTGNRYVDGDNNSITFDNFNNFQVFSGGTMIFGHLLSPNSQVSIDNNLITINSTGGTGGQVQINTDILSLVSTGTITLDATASLVISSAGFPKYTLPLNSGTNGQVLTTDGAGTASWQSYSSSTKAYGSFYDLNNQTALANQQQAMQLGNTDMANLVSIANNGSGNPTRITVAKTGKYNLQFSTQVHRNAGGSTESLYIWIAVNGNYVPATNTVLALLNNTTYIVAAWNFFVSLNSGQYVELFWMPTASTIGFDTVTPPVLVPPIPTIPSVIVTINEI